MQFHITDGNGTDLSSVVTVTRKGSVGGTDRYDVRTAERLKFVRVEWAERMLDHMSVWHPTCGRDRRLPQFFCAQRTDACFYRGAPVLATVRADGSVHRVVALKDAAVSSSLGYYVDDFSENDEVIFSVVLYDVPAGYATVLRIDEKRVPLADALGDVWRWWNSSIERAVPLPEAAFAPLYSTWYSFHQTPEQAALTEELRLAAELGFRTVILDDGWQFEGTGTKDYRKSGDWQPAPDKFPDFKGFVRDVHSFGQKLVLWFAVPFVGFESAAYRRFRDRLLFREEGYLCAGTLDIRFPEVRAYLTGTYLRFIREYDIDGLKLDFIDNFRDTPEIPPFGDGMDAPTVALAVKLLLEELCRAAVTVKPDFLMEFRQYYVGPEILRFGNMLRVGDCAFDAATNRIGAADLRMMTRDVAVHSDMLLWSPDETPENCAMQLLNVLFAVPQISIRPSRAGEAQRRLLKTYLSYWEQNRDVLMGGRFSVRHPEAGYSSLSAESAGSGKRITVLYTESSRRVDGREEDIWNATGEETVVLLNEAGRELAVAVYDCFGEPVRRLTTAERAIALTAPVAGRVTVAPSRRQAPAGDR